LNTGTGAVGGQARSARPLAAPLPCLFVTSQSKVATFQHGHEAAITETG
jgi:hypothetical protein